MIVYSDSVYSVHKDKTRGTRAVYAVWKKPYSALLSRSMGKNIGEASNLNDACRIIEKDKQNDALENEPRPGR